MLCLIFCYDLLPVENNDWKNDETGDAPHDEKDGKKDVAQRMPLTVFRHFGSIQQKIGTVMREQN